METRLNLDILYPAMDFEARKNGYWMIVMQRNSWQVSRGRKPQSLCGAIVKPLRQAQRVKPRRILSVLDPDPQSLELGHHDTMPMLPKWPR